MHLLNVVIVAAVLTVPNEAVFGAIPDKARTGSVIASECASIKNRDPEKQVFALSQSRTRVLLAGEFDVVGDKLVKPVSNLARPHDAPLKKVAAFISPQWRFRLVSDIKTDLEIFDGCGRFSIVANGEEKSRRFKNTGTKLTDLYAGALKLCDSRNQYPWPLQFGEGVCGSAGGLVGSSSYLVGDVRKPPGEPHKRTGEHKGYYAEIFVKSAPKPDDRRRNPINGRAQLYLEFWRIVGFVVTVSVFLGACYFLGGRSARRADMMSSDSGLPRKNN